MAESWTVQELVNAGWGEADLEWETLLRDAVADYGGADAEAAEQGFGTCVRIARTHFDPHDPRLGTALANYAICRRASGEPDTARGLLRDARTVWEGCDNWIANMTAPRSARSSLFHMRMEQKHRGAYEERWRIRWRELADEARSGIAAMVEARNCPPDLARDSIERWKRECPAMLNDSRKLMAATILLLPTGNG